MLAYKWVLVPDTMAEENKIFSATDFRKETYADMDENKDTKAGNNLMSCPAKSWTTYGKITQNAAVPESCECFMISIVSSYEFRSRLRSSSSAFAKAPWSWPPHLCFDPEFPWPPHLVLKNRKLELIRHEHAELVAFRWDAEFDCFYLQFR